MVRKLFLNNKFILVLILVNTIVLFAGGYIKTEYHRQLFLLADNLLTTFFIFELIVKFKEWGITGYFKSDWNKMDFILIVVSIPALISYIPGVDMYDLSFLLVFRIIRIFKVFRFIKFIPNVEQLVAGVQRALKASVFVILGFLIYLVIIGILSFYLFQNSNSDYFENPTVSLYSTFKIFTVEGWFEIPEIVAAGYSDSVTFLIYLFFIFVVITGGIFGLSLVNSIFVDSMVSDNTDDIEKKIDNLDSKIIQILNKLKDHET